MLPLLRRYSKRNSPAIVAATLSHAIYVSSRVKSYASGRVFSVNPAGERVEDGLFPAGYSMRQFKHGPAAGSEDAVIKASALRRRPVKVTGGIERHAGVV